jgi:hypothetical protein
MPYISKLMTLKDILAKIPYSADLYDALKRYDHQSRGLRDAL